MAQPKKQVQENITVLPTYQHKVKQPRINAESLRLLRSVTSRFLRGNAFIEIGLVTASKNQLADTTTRQRQESLMLVCDGQLVTESELKLDSPIDYLVTVHTTGHKSDFKPQALKAFNKVVVTVSESFRVSYNGDTLQGDIGQLPEKMVIALIQNHVNKKGVTRQWNRKAGVFSATK